MSGWCAPRSTDSSGSGAVYDRNPADRWRMAGQHRRGRRAGDQPGQRRGDRARLAGHDRRCGGRARSGVARLPRVGEPVRPRARPHHARRDGHLPPEPGRRGARPHPRARQAAERLDQGVQLQRRRDRLLRRGGPPPGWDALRRGSRPDAQLRAQAAGRRGGGDHAVELPGGPAGLEARPWAGGGLHVRDQATERGAAGRDPVREGVRRGGHPARRGQHRHRAGAHGRRGVGDQPAQPQDRVHWLDGHRPVDRRAGRAAAQSRHAGIGRQRAVRRV